MPNFVDDLAKQVTLTPDERAVLQQAGVHSAEEMLSLLYAFPSLSQQGVNVTKLEKAGTQRMSVNFMKVATSATAGAILPLGRGALPPPKSKWKTGAAVPKFAAAAAAPPPAAVTCGALDLRPKISWPVRYQGQRGTCVAHAVVALLEHLSIATEPTVDFSEQFLFWAAKMRDTDPNPLADGTFIRCAKDVLQSVGVCEESFWHYNGTPIAGNVTQEQPPGIPTPTAIANANTHTHSAALFNDTFNPPAGAAQALCSALQTAQRPVAISLPVFADPLTPKNDNWQTLVGWQYGRVLDPPPGAVVIAGHAVCITGFAPDPAEPMGGYFVLRNSWSGAWGTGNPSPNSKGPEQGYGWISASYIENHLWEMCQL